MADYIKSREQLISFFKGEMHGPLDHSSVFPDISKLKKYNLDDELQFETYKDARIPAIQENGNEILNLVSPLGDEEPTRRYGVGVLYPFKVETNDDEDEDNKLEFYDKPENISEDIVIDKKLKEDLFNKKLKRGKKKTKGDFVESVADVRTSNTLKQSSMGISFFANLTQDSILKIHNKERNDCGIYQKKEVQVKENTTNNEHYWWFRKSIILDFEFKINDILSKQDGEFEPINGFFEVNNIQLECKLISRKLNNTNLRLITIYLVNRSIHKSTNDELCLFQSQFCASFYDKSGKILHCIEPYPEGKVTGEDENKESQNIEEDESLDLIFRNKKTFAIGHGCSASWSQIKNQELASEISATHFPVFDSANITPEIIFEGKTFEIPMSLLADLHDTNEDQYFKPLKLLVSLYEKWISNNEKMESDIDKEYLNAANRNNIKCKETLNKINNGIKFLQTNKNALKAFQLANHAILSQQIRTKRYKDDEREWIEGIDGRVTTKTEYEEPNLLEIQTGIGNWRPFQIAFILSCIQSTVQGEDIDRENVELIFFPTGGGKTEAYLGLIAFLGFFKRITNTNHKGVDVIMRYTLRLLTTQQFTRAASLICSMEKIRQENTELLGNNEFSIGVWLGQATTPNRKEKARTIVRRLQEDDVDSGDEDPFLLTKCPWCSAGMGLVPIKKMKTQKGKNFPKLKLMGIRPTEDTVKFMCEDRKCHFSIHNKKHLPIYVIDDDIYEKTPTVLIATVDKFAQVTWMPNAKSIFGFDSEGNRINDPPSLILQDELHLITGPLGSMFGLYETLIEDLCTDKRKDINIKPKIICSTATIRRYANQVANLYNRKSTSLFPPLGMDIEDNFFGRYKYKDGKLENPKKFIGIHASSIGSTQTAQVRVYSALLQSVMFMEEEDRDPWFTLMNFFGSIRELATTLTLLETDIPNRMFVFLERFNLSLDQIRKLGKKGNQTFELTSRLKNQEIPKAISNLEKTSQIDGCVDVCLASNIIEVGVDIDRLSLLTIFGQPKSTSSYIQVSGRIGRRWQERPGLVITIFGPMRPRDKSHFEKFKSYHNRLYAQVEPSSVTPFSKPVLDRALHALMVGYVRMTGNSEFSEKPVNAAGEIPNKLLDDFYNVIKKRILDISNDEEEIENFEKIFEGYRREWKHWKRSVYAIKGENSSNPLMHTSGSYVPSDIAAISWPTPTSLRSVDAECMTYVTSNYRIAAAEADKDGETL